jgi:hypothetical protein
VKQQPFASIRRLLLKTMIINFLTSQKVQEQSGRSACPTNLRLHDWNMSGPNRAARGFTAGYFDYAEKNSTIVDPDTTIATNVGSITASRIKNSISRWFLSHRKTNVS